MTRRQKGTLIAVIAAVLAGAAWYQFGGQRTAPGQPPLVELDGASFEELRNDFNGAADRTRLIVLLSPT